MNDCTEWVIEHRRYRCAQTFTVNRLAFDSSQHERSASQENSISQWTCKNSGSFGIEEWFLWNQHIIYSWVRTAPLLFRYATENQNFYFLNVFSGPRASSGKTEENYKEVYNIIIFGRKSRNMEECW